MNTRCKELRTQNCMTQRQVAASLHITRQAYSMLERGEREPSIEFLTAFADLFHVSLDYLLRRDDEPPACPVNAAELELVRLYRSLDEPGKDYILNQTEYECYLTRRFRRRKGDPG